MKKKKVTITDPNGLHARPAAVLAKRVKDFQADIRLITAKETVEAGDLFAVLGCDILCGEEIEVECQGPDEEEAMQAVLKVIAANGVDR